MCLHYSWCASKCGQISPCDLLRFGLDALHHGAGREVTLTISAAALLSLSL